MGILLSLHLIQAAYINHSFRLIDYALPHLYGILVTPQGIEPATEVVLGEET